MKTQDYYLIKKNSNQRVMFPAAELEDGMLVTPQGQGMLIGDEVKEAGFSIADTKVPASELPATLKDLVLRVGDNRGHVVEKRESHAERAARAAEERKKQNAFLKERGYRWVKKDYYASGPGELWAGWFLLNPDGIEVIGWQEIGEEPVQTGPPLETILTDLGYYGDEARAALQAKREHAQLRKVAMLQVMRHIKTEPHTPTPAIPDSKNAKSLSSMSRAKYLVTDEGIWHWRWNGSDGDDWTWNNDGMYIASRYDYSLEVARAIEFLQRNQ